MVALSQESRIYIDISEALNTNNIWEAAKLKGAPVSGTILCVPDPSYTFWTWYEPKDQSYIVEWEKNHDTNL